MLPQELRDTAAHARSLGLRLHSHLSETVIYQQTAQTQHQRSPIDYAASVDWLGPDVWFAHLVKLDPEEIDLLGAPAPASPTVRRATGGWAAASPPSARSKTRAHPFRWRWMEPRRMRLPTCSTKRMSPG
jgi:Cytosine deaminase and related metal-dependent hydrolases